MSVLVGNRADISLEAVRRVGWDGESIELAPAALARMDRSHAALAAFVEARLAEDPGALIYGMTTAPGDGAAVALTAEARARRPTRLWTAHAFGEPLPDRVVRAIVLARLSNFVEGHAAVRGAVAQAVAAMLDAPLPAVPGQGSGGSGEVVALGRLFYDLSTRMELTPKERMALINGSPCAAALAADSRSRAATAGADRGRLRAGGRGRARSARGVRGRSGEPLGRRARGGRTALAAGAAGRRQRRAPDPPGIRELPHPAARARAGAPGAGRGRGRRPPSRCARSPTTPSSCRRMTSVRWAP